MRVLRTLVALTTCVVQVFAFANTFASTSRSGVVPGNYIVQLQPFTNLASISSHHIKVRQIHARNRRQRRSNGVSTLGVQRKFHIGDFKAYSGSFDATTISELRKLPEVLHIESDFIMTTSTLSTQDPAPWNLARLSSRSHGATSYFYDSTGGIGTYSYVVDTGIRITHSDFAGRALWGYNVLANTSNSDNNGHGTHVAGILGGTTYGVAKNTTLIAVKVFEGDRGTASTVMAGFEWAANDIVNKSRQDTAVINMSLGGSGSDAWDAAITAAWAQGVLAVVAAGNENTLASERSPSRSPEVLCVGNTAQDDARYTGTFGSNYGDAVDVWAPGTNVTSAYYLSDVSTARLTGTSMSSPLVAGLVSYFRGLEGEKGMSAQMVKQMVLLSLIHI